MTTSLRIIEWISAIGKEGGDLKTGVDALLCVDAAGGDSGHRCGEGFVSYKNMVMSSPACHLDVKAV